ncbi:MAG: RNA polymerase factor sigma-54 [Muribaculaceae bacterium]|nr:RNA polymerase factor sigma-54 [Muribaculaceae bacterium]
MANKTTTKIEIATKSKQLQRELGRLLEMDVNEMAAEVQNQLDSNPALEAAVEDNDVNRRTEDGRESETAEVIQRNDYADEEDIPPSALWFPRRGSDDERGYVPEVVNEISLQDYLLEQLSERRLSPKDELIARNIIGNLDGNGYLSRSARSIADDLTFNEGEETETHEVERVLAVVRRLDPPGIAAFNLRDCLLLQLQRMAGEDARLAYSVIDTCFDDFSRKRYDDISDSLKVSREEVTRVVKEVILALNPKPGSAYSSGRSEEHSQQITPDFNVAINGDTLTVTLNNRIPELSIAETYERLNADFERRPPVTSRAQNQMRIVRDGYNRAKGYLNLLKMRKTTLFECMREICRRQREFFFTGDTADLKPMTLQNIADAVGRDVSVISRAMANKYVDTQWGIKPLRFFFSEGINGVSTTEIKEALRRVVDGENKQEPFTDAQLCDLLRQQGYEVARRTIGKYRDAAGIPKAAMRKAVH